MVEVLEEVLVGMVVEVVVVGSTKPSSCRSGLGGSRTLAMLLFLALATCSTVVIDTMELELWSSLYAGPAGVEEGVITASVE